MFVKLAISSSPPAGGNIRFFVHLSIIPPSHHAIFMQFLKVHIAGYRLFA